MRKIKRIEKLVDLIYDDNAIGVYQFRNKTIQIGLNGNNPNERVRRVYQRREEKGLCKRCGKRKPKKGYKSCSKCMEEQRERRKNGKKNNN